MSELDAVAFDMDGLMFNTEELYQHVGRVLLERRGHSLTQELLDQMLGRPGRVALQAMIDMHRLDATVEQLQAETDELFPPIVEKELRPLPGLLKLLDALERHEIPKAVCTSSGRAFTERALRQCELRERFDFVLTGEDVERGKPSPDIYLQAAGRWGLAPERMLVLEDTSAGLRAAVAAGAYAIAVPGPHSARHDFSGARHVADSLADPCIYAALAIESPGAHSD